jgi:16S rRNA processing protein RimM
VDSLFETGANDVLVVKGKNNKRILIPFVMDEIIKEVNIDLEYIKVDWSI